MSNLKNFLLIIILSSVCIFSFEREAKAQLSWGLLDKYKVSVDTTEDKVHVIKGIGLFKGRMTTDGQLLSPGAFYWFNNGNIYIGEIKNNVVHGEGTMYYSNGNIYEGYWNEGFYNGYGTMYWENGEIWVGIWVDGMWLCGRKIPKPIYV